MNRIGDKLLQLAQTCAQRIRAHLGVRLSSLPGRCGVPAAGSGRHGILRAGNGAAAPIGCARARARIWNRGSPAAPSNPLVHSGLAAAWSMLGLDHRAREEAKQALDSSAGLGRVDQLEIEGRYRDMAHDWPRAIQVYQALFTLLPDDLEYGLLLACAEARGGKAQDAIATVGALRHLPGPLRDDPRIDLAEAQAAGALADFAHTRRAAHVGGREGRSRTAPGCNTRGPVCWNRARCRTWAWLVTRRCARRPAASARSWAIAPAWPPRIASRPTSWLQPARPPQARPLYARGTPDRERDRQSA